MYFTHSIQPGGQDALDAYARAWSAGAGARAGGAGAEAGAEVGLLLSSALSSSNSASFSFRSFSHLSFSILKAALYVALISSLLAAFLYGPRRAQIQPRTFENVDSSSNNWTDTCKLCLFWDIFTF